MKFPLGNFISRTSPIAKGAKPVEMQDKSNPTAAGKADDESLSEEELVSFLAGEPDIEAEETEEEEPEESEETEEETEEVEPEESEEEEEEPDEVSGLNFDELTDEQWEVVRTKLKSRAAADIKSLKQQLAAKDQALAALQQQAPKTAQPQPVESPLLKGVGNTEQLAAKVTELQENAEAIEALLDDHEGYAADDEIELGKHTYKKSEWKQALRNIRKTLDKAVPYMQSQFTLRQQWTAEQVQYDEAAKKQVPEIEDEESEVGKAYMNIMSDPRLKKVQELVPELAPQLGYLMAHTARSLFGGKAAKAKVTPPTTTGAKTKVRPPSSPSGVAAVTSKVKSPEQKTREAKMDRFSNSGNPEDLIAAWS